MRRVVWSVLSFCVLASFAVSGRPAKADDAVRFWYARDCCYVRVVRHLSAVRYVRVPRRYYRDGDVIERPYRYYGGYRYPAMGHVDGSEGWRFYRGYRYANFVPPPDCRLVRIADLDGTWIWARRAGCWY